MLVSGRFLLIIGLLTLPSLTMDLYVPGLPIMIRDLNTNYIYGQLTLTLYLFGMAFGELFLGPLSDVFGRRYVSIISLIFATILSLGVLWTNTWFFLPLRFLLGFAAGGIMVISQAMLRDISRNEETLSHNTSVAMGITLLGPVIAPILGGFLLQWVSWRDLFILTALYSFILLLWFIIYKRRQRSAISFTQMMTGYHLAFTHIKTILLIVCMGLSYGVIIIYIFSFAHIFEDSYGFSPFLSGIFYGISAFTAAMASIFNVVLIKLKIDIKRIIFFAISESVIVALIGVMLLLLFHHISALLFIILSTLLVIGLAIGFPNTFALVMNPYRKNSGTVASIAGVTEIMIGALVSALIGLFPPSALMVFGSALSLLFITWVLFTITMALKPIVINTQKNLQ